MKVFLLFIFLFSFSLNVGSYEITQERILEIKSQVSLPPDPGLNGETHIPGNDVDGDGMRDDIQRYLEFWYFDEPKLKKLFYHEALSEPNFIAASEQSKEYIQELIKNTDESFWCLSGLSKINKHRDFDQERKELNRRTLNTVDRFKAYMISNSKLAGTVWTAKDPDTYLSYCRKYGLSE